VTASGDKKHSQSKAPSTASSKAAVLTKRNFQKRPEIISGLHCLPDGVLEEVLTPMLSPDSKAKASVSGQQFNELFQLGMAVEKLLAHVARGEQAQAEAMLKSSPKLLLHKGNVTDYSGRTFHNITAFQYALWAYDRHMWDMLLNYFPRDGVAGDALKQLNELEAIGVKYQLKGSKTQEAKHVREPHYDWKLSTELTRLRKSGVDEWRDINQAIIEYQQLAPAHIANEYCHPSRSFSLNYMEMARFDDSDLPRSFEVEDVDSPCNHWFPLDDKSVLLGDRQRVTRSNYVCATMSNTPSSTDDLAMKSLRGRRELEYRSLKYNLSIHAIKEKIFKELKKIIEDVSYWSDKTHYQFFFGGKKHNEHRISDHISKMLQSEKFNFNGVTDVARQAIKPGLLAKFFGRTEYCSTGRDPATHEFYKMLAHIRKIADDINEAEPEEKIQRAINKWKKDYMSTSTSPSPDVRLKA
jgi:hypothetical protein